jgi:hypothetical protein
LACVRLVPVPVKPVKGIRRQFFSLPGISHQPQQRFHQSRIVFHKEFFETAIGARSRLGSQKECLVTLLHTR